MEDTNNKKDRRSENGGARKGCGRKSTEEVFHNRTMRIPDDIIKAAKEQGKMLTRTVIDGARKELKIKVKKSKK